MFEEQLNDVEIAPPLVVRQAARDFATALAETQQFIEFEAAAEALNKDLAAQKAIAAFQKKQQSLQMMLKLNAVSPEDHAELEHLYQVYMSEPSIISYLQAQLELISICQLAGDIISQSVGLNYAASCGASCCG